MFDSGITAKTLINQIREEAEIAYEVTDDSFIQWINSVEQLLYSEVIKEQAKMEFPLLGGTDNDIFTISLGNASPQSDQAPVRYEDIYAVYIDGVQLIESTLTSGAIFSGTYFKNCNGLGINPPDVPKGEKVDIIYFVRPALKLSENIADETIKVPVEFIEIVKSKLRGEAYKLANEDSLAAKWLNDYNVLLETFKLWMSEKQSTFGI